MTYAGHTALVTGAGRNIGRAVALAFAEAGVDVAVCVRGDVQGGERVADEIRARGAKTLVVAGDIADPTDDERMVREAIDGLGPVDYLVDCASPRSREGLLAITVERWNEVLDGALSATFHLARLVLPGMVERGFGRIVAIGGPVTDIAVPDFAHVVSAKHGLQGLIRSIALEFGPHGVTANLVSPGWMDTPRDPAEYPNWPPSAEQLQAMISVPRLGQPEEVAAAVLYLASDEAGYVTGQNIHVDGGLRAV